MTSLQFDRVKSELGFFVAGTIQCKFMGSREWKELQVHPNRFLQSRALEAILKRHKDGSAEIGLNRKYDTHVKWKGLNVPGQSVLAIDIDGRSNTDLDFALKTVVEVFEEVKFIEYSSVGNGYHLYVELDRPIVDEEIRSTVTYFRQLGATVEIKLSSQKLRFPMGGRYSVFGTYDPESPHCVKVRTTTELFELWSKREFVVPFPLDLAWFRVNEGAESPKSRKTTRNSSKEKSVSDLMANSELDFGPGTRHRKMMRIVGYCARYRLGYETFVKIFDHHNKGSTTITDTRRIWDWAIATWRYDEERSSTYSMSEFKKINEQKLAEIALYAGDITITEPERAKIKSCIDSTLEAFIIDKVKQGMALKNRTLMLSRFEAHIFTLCTFVKQYQSAKAHEWEYCMDEEKAQPPFSLLDTQRGVPISHRFLQWLKPKLKCSHLTTLLPYLVNLGLVRAVPLSETHISTATYAPGRCIYYEVNFS